MKLLIVAAFCVAACAATSLVQPALVQPSAYYPSAQIAYTSGYAAYPAYSYQQVASPLVVQKPGIKYVGGISPVSSVYYSPYSSYYYPSVGYNPYLIYGGGKQLVQVPVEGGQQEDQAKPEKPSRIQQSKDSYHY